MPSLEAELNEYLFHEFGRDLDGDVARVSDSWPFALRKAGERDGLIAFMFDDDEGQPYYALAGDSMTFIPAAGMTFDDLCIQREGARWIGARDPVDLAMSLPGDPMVPSGLERRAALEALADGGDILEGLFLRAEGRYLGLFRRATDGAAIVVGLPGDPFAVGFADASAWRRLAWAVGAWLASKTAPRPGV